MARYHPNSGPDSGLDEKYWKIDILIWQIPKEAENVKEMCKSLLTLESVTEASGAAEGAGVLLFHATCSSLGVLGADLLGSKGQKHP